MKHTDRIRSLLDVLFCLQSGEALSKPELAEACHLDEEEVLEHIRALMHAGFNVLYDVNRLGYWLPGGTYLPPTELTLEEILSLLHLALLPKRGANGRRIRKHDPLDEALNQAAIKLFNRLPPEVQHLVGDIHDKRVLFRRPFHGGLDRSTCYLNELQEAIREQVQVKIRYDSDSEESHSRFTLYPYRLMFVNRKWYVIGSSTRQRSTRAFEVSRILDLRQTQKTFEIPEGFSLANHFGCAWRFHRDRKHRTPVQIRFSTRIARDVAEVTWHRTQKASFNPDGTLDFQVVVDGLEEIAEWVLGFGTDAEVLSPPELREMVANRSREMLSVYEREEERIPFQFPKLR